MAAKRPVPPKKARPKSAIPIVGLILGGGGLAVVFGVAAVFLALRFLDGGAPPLPPEPEPKPDEIAVVAPPPPPPPSRTGPWWDDVPEAKLGETVAKLKLVLPPERALFTKLGNRSDTARLKAYQGLTAKLAEMIRDPKAKEPLGRLVIDCYAFDPVEKNVAPLRKWLVDQVPPQNAAYPPGYQSEHLDVSLWAMDISCQALTNKYTKASALQELSQDLGKALEFSIDPTLPPLELKARAEKLLALRCYNNLVPSVEKSVEAALTLRDTLAKKFAVHLSPTFREKIDIELAVQAFPDAGKYWPAYSSMLRECLNSENVPTQLEIVSLYEQADPAMAAKLDPVLASQWKECADAALTQEAKVRAMQRALGVLNPADRITRLEKLTTETFARAKPKAEESRALLQETARLAHASTLACALLRKEFGLARFDQLIAKIPELDEGETKPSIAKNDKTKDPETKPKETVTPPLRLMQTGVLTLNSGRYPRRGSFFNLHPVTMKAGRTYDIHMLSSFDNYLYLENSGGLLLRQDDDSGGGLNARIVYTAPFDGVYRVIATSCAGNAFGPYSLSVQEVQGFADPGFPGPFFPGKRRPFPGRFPPFGPGGFMPPPPPIVIPGEPAPEEKPKPKEPAGPAPQLDDNDVKNLKENAAKTRIKALQDISDKLEGDLTQNDIAPRHAREIARYLVIKVAEGAAPDAEVGQVAPKLASMAKSRNVLLALAYFVDVPAAKQGPTQTVVGALLTMDLRFGASDWRSACRKLLLLQALDLTGKDIATQASGLMRDYYLEQGVLLGMNAPDSPPLARPSQVMERLIKHLGAKLNKETPSKEQKEYLDALPRQLLATRSTAQNDLEYTVMLQRVWFKVLSIHLEQRRPQRTKDLRQVTEELNGLDRQTANLLEQLRGGEEKILKLWGLALDLK